MTPVELRGTAFGLRQAMDAMSAFLGPARGDASHGDKQRQLPTARTSRSWGINGAAGVLASSFAVAISMAFGIYVTFYASALCYALLIPAGLLIGFPKRAAGLTANSPDADRLPA